MDLFNSWLVNRYIAHRGLHDSTHPENSMSAFENAIKFDYAIELDVHQIEDGTIVVFHDETLMRMTGRDGYITQVKNKEELENFRLLGTDQKIPTLEEVLEFVNGKVPVLIEIKDYKIQHYNPQNIFESNLFEILKNYNGEYAIMSFNPYVLKWFKIHAPEVIRGQLSCFFRDNKMKFVVKYALKRMLLNKKTSEPHFIAYDYHDLPNRYVKKYKKLPLLAWAIPNQQEYMRVAPHCDNIIFEGFRPKI